MTDDQLGRDRLLAWRAEGPKNYYEASPNLARVLVVRAGPDRFATMEPKLARFGRVVAETVEPAVVDVERHREFPALLPYDGVGRSVATVEFHPAHQRAGHAVWSSGLLAGPGHGTDSFTQAGLFYLLSFAGEGGHACPAVCTAGLTRAMTRYGSPALQDRYLPGLTSTDYDHALRGSQFLTELQGGSDVGANTTVAHPDPTKDGSWRVTGEKWFCSVADADLFAVTARPEGAPAGTRGLGCFVVPRTLDGTTPNGFRMRRLKDKLGTRALASAEIEFEGAVAWPIGGVDQGFRIAVEELLNTSRWLNAVGSTGLMRRAFLEAASYATYREAFGVPIITFPIVREQLVLMKVEEHAALASTMALTGLVDRLDAGTADDHERAVHRFLVNANKYVTSIAATAVVHQGIELLGGNGTIEDFTPLPRLYRDAIVYESWEGTHNVLCAQVARDCSRFDLLDSMSVWVRRELPTTSSRTNGVGTQVLDALERIQRGFRAAVGAGAPGAAGFRRRLDEMVRIIQATCLLVEAATAPGDQAEKEAVAMLFVRRYLVPGHDPDTDPDWNDLVTLALGTDGT